MKDLVLRYKIEIFLFCITVVLGTFLFVYTNLRFPNDDQFILYRYIDNIASGNGFVYNTGERILGSTTPLFTLLGAFLKLLFFGIYTPTLISILNIMIVAISSVLIFNIFKRFLSVNLSIVGSLVFILNLSRLAIEGMESGLLVLLILTLVYFLLNERWVQASFVLGLLVLSRPEAVMICLVVFIYFYQKIGIKETWRMFLISVGVTLPWLVFATLYFGSFVPQSLIAKMQINDIINQPFWQAIKVQLSNLSRIYWGRIFDPNNLVIQSVVNLLPLMVFVCIAAVKRLNRNTWFIFMIPFLYFAFFGVSNPVMFPWYWSQMEPLWILLSFLGFAYFFGLARNIYLQVMLVVIILVGPVFHWYTVSFGDRSSTKMALFDIGLFLKENVMVGETVGLNNGLGILGYVSNAHMVDFFGLVNRDSPYFYPINDSCVDMDVQYIIPDDLLRYFKPNYLVVSSKDELLCVKDWFWTEYKPVYSINNAVIYKR